MRSCDLVQGVAGARVRHDQVAAPHVAAPARPLQRCYLPPAVLSNTHLARAHGGVLRVVVLVTRPPQQQIVTITIQTHAKQSGNK